MEVAMKSVLRAALSVLLLLVPLAASAADGYVTVDLSLRAGPDTSFPLITMIPQGTPVSVQGCVDGYAWCDVAVDTDRGWVSGDYLAFNYDNAPVYINDYGPRLGIPIVTFTLGVYWDHWYRGRPWYSNRSRWNNWRPAYRPLRPRPPSVRPPPPRPPWGGGNRPTPRPPIGTKPPPRPPGGGGNRPPPRPPGNIKPPPRPPGGGINPPPKPPGGGFKPPPRPPGGNGPGKPNPGAGRPLPGGPSVRPTPRPADKSKEENDRKRDKSN
jgi:uncharacterized protein YraI